MTTGPPVRQVVVVVVCWACFMADQKCDARRRKILTALSATSQEGCLPRRSKPPLPPGEGWGEGCCAHSVSVRRVLRQPQVLRQHLERTCQTLGRVLGHLPPHGVQSLWGAEPSPRPSPEGRGIWPPFMAGSLSRAFLGGGRRDTPARVGHHLYLRAVIQRQAVALGLRLASPR